MLLITLFYFYIHIYGTGLKSWKGCYMALLEQGEKIWKPTIKAPPPNLGLLVPFPQDRLKDIYRLGENPYIHAHP